MSNQNETSDSKGPEGFSSSPNLERRDSPNRLVADEAIDNDNGSAASLNAETAEKLHFSRDDPLLIQQKEKKDANCISVDDDTCRDVKCREHKQLLLINDSVKGVNGNLNDVYSKLSCSNMRNTGPQSTPGKPKADDFALAVTRMAVAQICENVGFQGVKDSALGALTDVAIRFLCDLGKTSASLASLSGRTQCNIFDIIRGFEDMGAPRGFSGASNSRNCIINSGYVKELMDFVISTEEIPFAQPVPSFPVVRDRKVIPSFADMNETPPGKHMPSWLPALPDPHTYVHTPMWNGRAVDLRAEKIEQARQRRKAERALLSLQQRLLSSVSSSQGRDNCVQGNGAAEAKSNSNPFLSRPFQPGEKDASKVVLPDKVKESVSLMDAFAPAIEAAKEGELGDNGESEPNLLPDKRASIVFKFKTGKKLLCEPLDLGLLRKGGGRVGNLLGREDERDDKKRRAEYILRQSMENPLELTQL